jgi:predicted transcriptional regulator
MKVLTFGIKSETEIMKEFKSAWAAARGGKSFKRQEGVYFTSLEAARNFLTPGRMELLHLIRVAKPHSIYSLAKLAKRRFPSVFKDVELLKRHGLVSLARDKHSARRAITPHVDYGAINLWISV